MFDTYNFFKELKKGGVSTEQAEAQIEAMRGAFSQETLATKQDVAELRAEVKHDVAELRAEVKHDVAELRSELGGRINLLQWMMGLVATGVGAQLIKTFFV